MRSDHLPQVRAQYEGHPYPVRKAEDERFRLIETYGNNLDQVNHHCFSGRRDLSRAFRALDAGGGTGDNAIFLAEQLRELGGEVVYIDFSQASMAVAQERARIRGLENIRFIHDSLLSLPDLGLEPFDYIVCSGVLHHLESPDAGLAALNAVLKPEGAMHVMLYGEIGRLGVYPMQEALKILAPETLPTQERLAIARQVLASMPTHCWFRHCSWFHQELKDFGDAGLYDLLLHSQDRAYRFGEIFDFAERQRLHVLKFLHAPGQSVRAFDAASHVKDPALAARINALPQRQKLETLELLAGIFGKHSFYLARTARQPAAVHETDLVPFMTEMAFNRGIYAGVAKGAAEHSGQSLNLAHQASGVTAQFPRTPHLAEIFRHMDGERPLREIYARVHEAGGPKPLALAEEFSRVFTPLNHADWMFLRAPGTPAVPHGAMRARMQPVEK